MSSNQTDRNTRIRQQIEAGRDAYGAAGDQTVINIAFMEGPSAPGPFRHMWGKVPPRNPGFTGRDGLLAAVRESLLAGDRTVVQALHGMGGVGKTQLAIEYAHRFADSYDVVWWITAEQPGLIGDQFMALAESLGCMPRGAGLIEAARQAVLNQLRYKDRWLLVFDNAEDPEDLATWLPGGTGHVLITSRTRRWTEVAMPVEVDVLARSESVTILRGRVPWLSESDAEQVAEAMGDLPLGVVQAAGYMADTGTPSVEYLTLLKTRAGQIMDQGRPSSYTRSLTAATWLAVDRLATEDSAAADLVAVCAFLAPEPVRPEWFTRHATQLPVPLADAAADPVAWRQVLARLGTHALARIDHDELRMHRLTQAIVRDHLPADRSSASRLAAESILAANHPGHKKVPSSWPEWARLLPHLIALSPEATTIQGLRQLAIDAAWYLYFRGDWRSSHDLAYRLYRGWHDNLGPNDLCTLAAAQVFATALRKLGRAQAAREMDEDTFTRRRQILGENHPHTLISANILAISLQALGETETACQLSEDTLERRRKVLGQDDPNTLISAGNLAGMLRQLGHTEAARRLDEDTLARRRRVLGHDHPDTLTSANNLAAILRLLGETETARRLDEDTLARRRRVLGHDHPDTLTSSYNLASTLDMLGQHQKALTLHQDAYTRRCQVLGKDHHDTHVSARSLQAITQKLGEAGSLELSGEVLERHRSVLGADPVDAVNAVTYLAVECEDEEDDEGDDPEYLPQG